MEAKTTKLLLMCVALLSLGGCKHKYCQEKGTGPETERVFLACLDRVKVQPSGNHEDNNGHVVEECRTAASRLTEKMVCEEWDD